MRRRCACPPPACPPRLAPRGTRKPRCAAGGKDAHCADFDRPSPDGRQSWPVHAELRALVRIWPLRSISLRFMRRAAARRTAAGALCSCVCSVGVRPQAGFARSAGECVRHSAAAWAPCQLQQLLRCGLVRGLIPAACAPRPLPRPPAAVLVRAARVSPGSRPNEACGQRSRQGSRRIWQSPLQNPSPDRAQAYRPPLTAGFCFYNHAAVAARAALCSGANRVAIIDWDVHHGAVRITACPLVPLRPAH